MTYADDLDTPSEQHDFGNEDDELDDAYELDDSYDDDEYEFDDDDEYDEDIQDDDEPSGNGRALPES